MCPVVLTKCSLTREHAPSKRISELAHGKSNHNTVCSTANKLIIYVACDKHFCVHNALATIIREIAARAWNGLHTPVHRSTYVPPTLQ